MPLPAPDPVLATAAPTPRWRWTAGAQVGLARNLRHVYRLGATATEPLGNIASSADTDFSGGNVFGGDPSAPARANARVAPEPTHRLVSGVHVSLSHERGWRLNLGAGSWPVTVYAPVRPPATGRGDLVYHRRRANALGLSAGAGYGLTLGRWTVIGEVGGGGLSPKRVSVAGGELRLRGRAFATAGLGVTHALGGGPVSVGVRYDYTTLGSRATVGLQYAW